MDKQPSRNGFKLEICQGKIEGWEYYPKPSLAALVIPSLQKCELGRHANRKTADGAVDAAGGDDLRKKRAALPEVSPGVRCPTGSAVIVSGPYDKRGRHGSKKLPGKLKVGNVIYAGSPNYKAANDWEECDKNLNKAVVASLNCGKNAKLHAMAFVLMSAGNVSGGKKAEEVAEIILKAIKEYEGYKELSLVSICVLGGGEVTMVKEVARGLGIVDDDERE